MPTVSTANKRARVRYAFLTLYQRSQFLTDEAIGLVYKSLVPDDQLDDSTDMMVIFARGVSALSATGDCDCYDEEIMEEMTKSTLDDVLSD